MRRDLYSKPGSGEVNWHDVLASESGDIPELQSLLKSRPLTTVFAYLVLRLVYFSARILFRMEVSGGEDSDASEAAISDLPESSKLS